MRRSTASLALMGTAAASARRYSATTMPRRSPGKKRTRRPPRLDLGGGQHRGHQRPIGVAVGGDDGVKRSAARFGSDGELLQTIELLVGDVLGVDGNEGLAAPGGDHLGAELAQDARQEIAPDRRVLIDEDAQAGEAAAGEAAQIAPDVALLGGAIERRQLRRTA